MPYIYIFCLALFRFDSLVIVFIIGKKQSSTLKWCQWIILLWFPYLHGCKYLFCMIVPLCHIFCWHSRSSFSGHLSIRKQTSLINDKSLALEREINSKNGSISSFLSSEFMLKELMSLVDTAAKLFYQTVYWS